MIQWTVRNLDEIRTVEGFVLLYEKKSQFFQIINHELIVVRCKYKHKQENREYNRGEIVSVYPEVAVWFPE